MEGRVLEKFQAFIKKVQIEKKIQTLNEEATKQSIILPILQLLGWEVFDTDEVSPEYSIESTRIDYALRTGTVNKVFIEVKRINEDLDKHQEQLLTYSFKQGVNLSILTNGSVWWFYLPLQEGSWEQRKFYAIDMYSQEIESISETFNRFLSKESVLNGDSLRNAKKVFGNRQKNDVIKKNIPKAWRKLHIEGDELLIELLAESTEKICGYRPEDKEISEFLYSIVHKEIPNTLNTKQKNKVKVPTSPNNVLYTLSDNFTYKKLDSFTFLNATVTVSSWRELMLKFIEIIRSQHKIEFDKITEVSGKKKPYFSKNKNELRRPKKIKNTPYFLETNLSANNTSNVIKEVLKTFNYDEKDLAIKLNDET